MLDRESDSLTAGCRISSLHLDYGADAQSCEDDDAVEISERGMRLRSRWQFSIGTQLSVAFVCHHPRRGTTRLTAEGIVVWCEPCGGKEYESTLLFLELPDELKQSLRELSFRLAAAKE
jgi:hypothetical protein